MKLCLFVSSVQPSVTEAGAAAGVRGSSGSVLHENANGSRLVCLSLRGISVYWTELQKRTPFSCEQSDL